MTVFQLRVLLSYLPQECQSWPIAYPGMMGDTEACVLLVCPADAADVHFPNGVVVVEHYRTTPDEESGITLYLPDPPTGPRR